MNKFSRNLSISISVYVKIAIPDKFIQEVNKLVSKFGYLLLKYLITPNIDIGIAMNQRRFKIMNTKMKRMFAWNGFKFISSSIKPFLKLS